MDHRTDMVDHRSSVNESGHCRLWISRLWLRCPQVDNFSRVGNFFNGFLNSSFSSSWDRLSCNMDTDRQLAAEDCRVMVRGVHCMVDHGCSMVDHRCSVVDDGWAVVDGVMDKGSRVDRGVMDSVNGSMC